MDELKKDVLIALNSQSVHDGTPDDPVEMITAGRYYKKNGVYYISYQETVITGGDPGRTTVKVEPDQVTILRFGPISGQLVFQRGKKHLSHYDLDVGSLSMGIYTRILEKSFDDRGGHLRLHYDVEIDNLLIGETSLELQVYEPGVQPEE